jgi:hypothetical protein
MGHDSHIMQQIWALAQQLVNPGKKLELVDENLQWPTAVLDLDGTLVHTLLDPAEIAVAEKSNLRIIRLPGKMGIAVQRPGLEQLFSSLRGYNVVIYSAGGSYYVNTVIEKLAEENPIMQGKICKILCRPALIRYSLSTVLPDDASLSEDGVFYVKDLRKARGDGNSEKVLIVDDSLHAYQVNPDMEDASFKRMYDFTANALEVPHFIATDPAAECDMAFDRVAQVFEEIAYMDDTLTALKNHEQLKPLSRTVREGQRATARKPTVLLALPMCVLALTTVEI